MQILCAIKGCEKHRDRLPVILDTWLKDANLFYPIPHIRFYTGEDLGVADDYLSLPEKTKAICAIGVDWDYVLMLDTDTYISLPRAFASGFEQHDYSGYVTKVVIPTWLTYPYCSGPSYWLSRKACRILAAADWNAYDNMDGETSHRTDEDCMVGAILAAHGIEPHHDERYVSPIGVLPDNDIISEHLSYTGPFTIEKMYKAHRKAQGLA